MPAGKGKLETMLPNSHFNQYYNSSSRSALHHHHYHLKHIHAVSSGQNRSTVIIHVTENDVLSGRGVNIAHHPGNERFRTLVTSRYDTSYCTSYSASEKRAVAEEIIRHIRSLNPPGRFLRRDGRGQVSRGLNGPWEELTEKEAVKKTCQALRDCNRNDREGYACGVVPPSDVLDDMKQRDATGMSRKQQAAAAAAISAAAGKKYFPQFFLPTLTPSAAAAASTSPSLKRPREQPQHFYPQVQQSVHPPTYIAPPLDISGRFTPNVDSASDWFKKQRTDDALVQLANDVMLIPQPLSSNITDPAIYDPNEFSTWPSGADTTPHVVHHVENLPAPTAVVNAKDEFLCPDNVLLNHDIQPTPVVGPILSNLHHPDIPISTSMTLDAQPEVDLVDNVLGIHQDTSMSLDTSKLMMPLKVTPDDILNYSSISNVIPDVSPPSPAALPVELCHTVYTRQNEPHSIVS